MEPCELRVLLWGASGWIEGNSHQFLVNLGATAIAAVFAFVATWIILKGLAFFMKLTISEKELEEGLDRALHGEEAYDY